MASATLSLFLLVLVHGSLFLSHLVYCNEEEDDLFKGINNFRQSLNLSNLAWNKNAACLADEIADELEEKPCSSADEYTIKPGNGPKFQNFNKLAHKCHININTTTDGVIWPVCVPNLDPDLVLHNYTDTEHAMYLNDSKYTGAGVGSEDDWMIVVLTTDTESGSFSGASALGAIAMVHYMVALLLELFLVLL